MKIKNIFIIKLQNIGEKKRYNNQEGVNMYDKNHVYFYDVKYDITGEGVLKMF